ncbi:unnamed protein product [Closterium sp. NIES-64]|nr:unnamed protein product [Closterium sp. NIES-64]
MEVFFWAVFGALVVLCAGLEGSKGQRDKLQTSPAFESFKNNYLLVYSLMMAGDWLQGPYVYALYQHYGYDKGDIGRLFIAGFGSSMVFGTIVGSLADKHGRRRASLTYCGVYVLSCLTKHSPDYRLLMLGRVLGGIATSLLFSAFESWLVAEHFKRGFEAQWLSVTFSSAIWLGNGLIAILSGLLANSLVTSLALGPVAPFDAAALVLLLGGAIITATWPENYGDSTDSKGLLAQFHAAASAIASGGLPSPQVGCHRLRWAAIASGGLPSPQVGCHRLRWAAIASGGLPSPQVGCHRLRWAAIASGGLPSPQVGCHRLRWAAIASGGLPSPQVGCHRLRWAAIASEGSSAIIAPSAGPQGRKPAEVRPEPVTPKTLFNGATAPRGADEINALSERTSALRINDLPVEGGVNGAEVNKPVANTSDKGNAKIQDLEDDGGYLSDDPDECQDPVVLNEIAAQAGVAITLLVPFAWSKEIPCIIVTVNHLLSLWGKHMSGNVCKTTRCQKLTPTFLSKQHFGRVEVVFLQEADAVFMRSREIEHYTTNDKKLVLGWQYPENKEYLRERAAHPEAIEVLLKGVPAVISPAMIMKNLVTAMLVKQGRTAFLDGSAFHRVLDPARSQQRASTLTSVSSSPRAAASLKITPAVKTLLADPAMAFTSTGGVWEEWVCAQEECGKAHGTSFETAVEHVQTIHHGTGLLKAGAATRVSMGKQNVAQVWKEFGLVLGVTVEGGEEPFRLVAAYLPAQACNRAKFYREQLEPFIQLQPQSSHLVVVGDLNMIADPDLDKSPGAGSGRENQRFIEMWQGHDLGDAIRVLHPTDKEYTFRVAATLSKSRIDRALMSASLLDKAGREPLERLLSRLAAALRAHDKEERKRVTATQLHLTEEVERMRHLVMGGPTDDQTLARLLTKEEQLEAYRENEREVFAGLTTELQGEIPSPYLSAKVKMRKERTLIEEVVFNGERHRGSQAVLKAASLYFEEAFREVQMEPQLACTDFAVDRVLPAAAEAVVRLGAPWAEPEVKAALKGDCGENFRSVEWGTGPTAEEGRRLIDPKARLDSMAIRTVGKYLTEQDATKRWLTEKAAAMAQGVATLFAHKSAGNHWEKGNQRWKAIAEIFRESPFAELPAPTNGWEVEWELLSFNRRIMFRGGSPFGNRKGAAGILKSRLGDLLQTKEDGSRPKRMGADQRGWEQTKEDGSRPKRMGADQRGWEQTKEDGSRPKRMGADQRGWEQTKEDGSRPKRMGADQRGWEQTKEDGSRPKRMGADQRGWEQRTVTMRRIRLARVDGVYRKEKFQRRKVARAAIYDFMRHARLYRAEKLRKAGGGNGQGEAMARGRQWPGGGNGQGEAMARGRQWPGGGNGQGEAMARGRQWPGGGNGQGEAMARGRQWPGGGNGQGQPRDPWGGLAGDERAAIARICEAGDQATWKINFLSIWQNPKTFHRPP